jgi:sporulation protein YlmC with PRC-barrel domain
MKSSFIVGAVAAVATFAAISAVNAQAVTAPSPSESATKSEMPKVTGAISPTGYATSQAATDWRSSKVVGLNVYNGKQEKIGDINDLIIDATGAVSHAVVGVGGFLGIGEKNVAIPFTSVKMSRDKDGKISAMVESTKEALTAAPAFKYFNS